MLFGGGDHASAAALRLRRALLDGGDRRPRDEIVWSSAQV